MAPAFELRLAAPPRFAPTTRALLARSPWVERRATGLALLYGHPQTARLAHYVLARPLLVGEAALFLDAANCFNPYLLTSLARRCGRVHTEGEFLRRVYISRAFTCYQLAGLIERTAGVLASCRARQVFLTGFPDIFDDDDVPATEAERILQQSLARLARLARRASIWVFSDQAVDSEARRAKLRGRVRHQATRVYRVEESVVGLELRQESPRPQLPSRARPPTDGRGGPLSGR